nr:hypothetical protein [Tanacetum cinerariifolium]
KTTPIRPPQSQPLLSSVTRNTAPHMRPLVSPLSILRGPSVPYASIATFAHSSLLRGPSVQKTGGPQDKLNDNVKTLIDNATHAFNILKTPEFPGGVNGAQPPFAHELIYLSDDD